MFPLIVKMLGKKAFPHISLYKLFNNLYIPILIWNYSFYVDSILY